MPFVLPQSIARFIDGAPLTRDCVGESPCEVHAFERGNDRFFLKASAAIYAPTTYSVMREASVLQWLDGKLQVPEVVACAAGDGHEFMITRAVPGRPLAELMEDEPSVYQAFAEALRLLQAVPVDGCPFDSSAAVRLHELEYLVDQGLIADDWDPDTWPELPTPQALIAHLHASVPTEDRVFSHGDLCDANLFIDARERLHFIDLGRGGLADRWLDIAFAHRNIVEELSPATADRFIARMGIPDQPARRLFFEQLDEMF